MHYNRFSWYDPAIARYILADPIEKEGGVKLYRYARYAPSNPVDSLTLLNDVLHGKMNTGESCGSYAADAENRCSSLG